MTGSRRRRAPIPKPEFTADGKLLCRNCDNEVPKGRTVYCSERCHREWMVKHSPEFAAALFRQTYGCRCSGCGSDEEVQKRGYEEARALLVGVDLGNLLRPFPTYQLDHIRPVADGGGECDLDNYRLLCRGCHSPITARFNHERAERKRAVGPWAASQRMRDEWKQPLSNAKPGAVR